MSEIVKIACTRCGTVKKTKCPPNPFVCKECKNNKVCIKCGRKEINYNYNGRKFMCKSCRGSE